MAQTGYLKIVWLKGEMASNGTAKPMEVEDLSRCVCFDIFLCLRHMLVGVGTSLCQDWCSSLWLCVLLLLLKRCTQHRRSFGRLKALLNSVC